jgi:hypothetical protein
MTSGRLAATLATFAAVGVHAQQTTTCAQQACLRLSDGQYACFPDANPKGYRCDGAQIVDNQGARYFIEESPVPGVAPSLKSASWTCTDAALAASGGSGYACVGSFVRALANGIVYQGSLNNREVTLTPLSLSSNQVPSGFTQLNDGSGNLLGPDGNEYERSNNRLVYVDPVPQGFAGDDDGNWYCPGEQLAAQFADLDGQFGLFSCSDKHPFYIRDKDGNFWRRVMDSDSVVPLKVETATNGGLVAPFNFTWTNSRVYTDLTGPYGDRWTVDFEGNLSRTPDGQPEVTFAESCNDGFPLPNGYACAGYGFGYILDSSGNFYVVRNGQILRLGFTGTTPPIGFSFIPGSNTLSGPAGTAGPVFRNTDQGLEIVEGEDQSIPVCSTFSEQGRLPLNFQCAEDSKDWLGEGNGNFGYAIKTESGKKYYYSVVETPTGTVLEPLLAKNGNPPAGFTTLPSSNDDVVFRGPDWTVTAVTSLATPYPATTTGTVFKADGTGALEPLGNQRIYGNPATTGASCDSLYAKADTKDFFDEKGFKCLGLTYNYVVGPGNQYWTLTDSDQLARLKVRDNVAPMGFTLREDGTLNPPQDNGFVYRVLADGKLDAVNPVTKSQDLELQSCPARLPQGFFCPSTNLNNPWGYVLGPLNPVQRGGAAGAPAREFWRVDRTVTPNELHPLRVQNQQLPAGFSQLRDGSFAGPFPEDEVENADSESFFSEYVYEVDEDGRVVSKPKPDAPPTIDIWCPDMFTTAPPWTVGNTVFECVETEIEAPKWCEFPHLSPEEIDECSDYLYKHDASTTGPREVILSDGSKYQVASTYGYLHDQDGNYYTLAGRNIVRLSLTASGDAPAGFSYLEGSTTRLQGNDWWTAQKGFTYEAGPDGILNPIAPPARDQAPTLQNQCPQGLLAQYDFSCVEDYSEGGFGFYARDDRVTLPSGAANGGRGSYYKVSDDLRSMSQLTIINDNQMAPHGFMYDASDTSGKTLIDPFGFKHQIQAESRNLQFVSGQDLTRSVTITGSEPSITIGDVTYWKVAGTWEILVSSIGSTFVLAPICTKDSAPEDGDAPTSTLSGGNVLAKDGETFANTDSAGENFTYQLVYARGGIGYAAGLDCTARVVNIKGFP